MATLVTLIPAEVNYTTGEQELLAVVHACKTWRCYLEGVQFTVVTDNNLLVHPPTSRIIVTKVMQHYFIFILFFGARYKEDAFQLMEISINSLVKVEPDCKIDIVTDSVESLQNRRILHSVLHQEESPCRSLPWVTRVACNQLNQMKARIGTNVVFVEIDEVFISSVVPVFNEDFDIALTVYDAHFLKGKLLSRVNDWFHTLCPLCTRPSHQINTGIMFIKNVSRKIIIFFEGYVSETLKQESHLLAKKMRTGGINQEVLMQQFHFSSSLERIFYGDTVIMSLPAIYFNHARYFIPVQMQSLCTSYSNRGDIRMFHFNKRKEAMLHCFGVGTNTL